MRATLILASSLLLTAPTPTIFAQDQIVDPRFGTGLQTRTGWFVSADALIWRANRSGLDYAVASNGVFPVGNVARVEPDFDTGIRLEIGTVSATGWDFRARFTDFGQTANSAFASNDPLAPIVQPTRQTALGVLTALSASASYDVDLTQFDAEIGYSLDLASSAVLRPYAGVRFMQLDQNMTTIYDIGIPLTLYQRQQSRAVGLTAGGEFRWAVFGPAVSLFGRAGVGALVGDFENSNYIALGIVQETGERTREAFLTLEAQLGINVRVFRGLNLAAGYEFYQFAGLPDFLNFDAVVSGFPASPDRGTASLGFDGFFARLVYNF